MTWLRLPGGAPVRSNPPWWGQRPDGCSDVLMQGVASWRRAPQMRWFSWVSVALTAATHSADQVRAQGVPRVVCVVVVVVDMVVDLLTLKLRALHFWEEERSQESEGGKQSLLAADPPSPGYGRQVFADGRRCNCSTCLSTDCTDLRRLKKN